MRKLLFSLAVIGLIATPAFAADYSTATYSQLESASDEISAVLARTMTRTDAAKAQFSQCLTDLSALQSNYGTVLTGVNALPAGTAKTNLLAKVNAFLADRNTLVTFCTSLESAVSAINP
jgi:hypothetical protein